MNYTFFWIFFLSFGFYSFASHADEIEWNYNQTARAKGLGCLLEEDVSFVNSGPELSIVFSKMTASLAHKENRLNTVNCYLHIPVRLKAGSYLAEFHHSLTYGYVREARTRGYIHATTTIDKQNLGRLIIAVPTLGFDEFQDTSIVKRHTAKWQTPQVCPEEDYTSILKLNVIIQAYRYVPHTQILIEADGVDLRYEAVGDVQSCRP